MAFKFYPICPIYQPICYQFLQDKCVETSNPFSPFGSGSVVNGLFSHFIQLLIIKYFHTPCNIVVNLTKDFIDQYVPLYLCIHTNG